MWCLLATLIGLVELTKQNKIILKTAVKEDFELFRPATAEFMIRRISANHSPPPPAAGAP